MVHIDKKKWIQVISNSNRFQETEMLFNKPRDVATFCLALVAVYSFRPHVTQFSVHTESNISSANQNSQELCTLSQHIAQLKSVKLRMYKSIIFS